MVTTAKRNAHDCSCRGRAARRLAFALAVAALCFESGAKADALSVGKRAFARHDYVRASSLLLAEAERGSPVAQTYLGYMYQYGLGVPQDYLLAGSWLHQAAEQGEPTGQFLLGLLFDKGYGVPQHMAALNELGPSIHHRSLFAPVVAARARHQTGVRAAGLIEVHTTIDIEISA